MASALAIVAGLVIGALVLAALLFVLIKVLGGLVYAIGAVTKHVFGFVFGMLQDAFRLVGAVIAGVVFSLLIGVNVLVGRWSGAKHFGDAMQTEVKTFGSCVYRLALGRPLKFLLLGGMVEGLEQRVPKAIEAAPGSDKPSKRTGAFDGYKIVGSLKGGGSGGRLYVAEPDAGKRVSLERQGFEDVDQVVIKSFSLKDGSSLPQIIRESRALEAARKLGLILEHEQSGDRFFYVMRYVPGETLTAVTTRLHAEAGADGLGVHELRMVCTFAAQLLGTLGVYHRGGLWHKDVKPDNVIVHDGEAHVVDLGLVTPLRSAMTLTTHGTEYFRDPELVRMALRGAKVHEVDGVKFDIYGAGAVLYSMVEDSFPAHGALSTVTKKCPDALRWVIRRAMAETNQRYATADEMLHDLQAVIASSDPFGMKPKDLPSMGGAEVVAEQAAAQAVEDAEVIAAAFAPASVGGKREREVAPERMAGGRAEGGKPSIRVVDWLTGGFVASHGDAVASPEDVDRAEPKAVRPASFRTAAEQRERARARAHAARERAHLRMSERRNKKGGKRGERYSNNPSAGVFFGLFLFAAIVVAVSLPLIGMLAPISDSAQSAADRVLAERDAVSKGIEWVEVYSARAGGDEVLVPIVANEDFASAPMRGVTGKRVVLVSDAGSVKTDPQKDTLVRTVRSRLERAGATLAGLGGGSGDGVVDELAPVLAELGVVVGEVGESSRELLRGAMRGERIAADAVVVVVWPGWESKPTLDVIGAGADVELAVLDALRATPVLAPGWTVPPPDVAGVPEPPAAPAD